MAEGIPPDVARFIGDNIHSVEQLEVLLLLRATAPAPWSPESVARELRIAPESAGARLDDLTTRGLLVQVPDADRTYRYEPKQSAMDGVVRALAGTYATRRVAVITLIFSKPNDAVRLFADAFKLRKRDDDD